MTTPQTDAQRLADRLESDDIGPVDHQAAALLRKQDELLRQALDALEENGPHWHSMSRKAIAAIKERLK